MSDPRAALSKVRRIVVKIGSSGLAGDAELPRQLAAQLASVAPARSFVIVSSGAIAIGFKRLGYRVRPKEMSRLQASAAAGQVALMRRWDDALAEHGLASAQVLLTHADLADRVRLNNAREALGALLEAGAVPIINENDTVATDEIRFGDNDQLAAMVTPLVGAELLVLLTDVDGVLDAEGRRLPLLAPEQGLASLPRTQGAPSLGSGGMASKVSAARKASRAGASVVIASARTPNVLLRLLDGEDLGTLVPCEGPALKARLHWIAYTLRPRGALLLDAGAARVLRAGRSSLLPVGVLGVRGQFDRGDAVRLLDPEGAEVGRGLTRLGAAEVARVAGQHGPELALSLGVGAHDLVVVHRDDLVIFR